MKKLLLLIISTTIIFSACKKDDNIPGEVKVVYNIGEQRTYVYNYISTKDNPQTPGVDSMLGAFSDTITLTVEKDTLINGINCRVLNYYSKDPRSFIRNISYIEQRSDGIYEIATLSYNSGEVFINQNPELIIPNPLRAGQHWGESPDGKNNANVITNISNLSIPAGNFICAEITEYDYPGDFWYHEDNTSISYYSSIGLIQGKLELYSERTINNIEWRSAFMISAVLIK